MKTGIIIITYNAHEIFLKQIERINRHCKDDFEIVIIDNSTRLKSIEAIEWYCTELNLKRIKTNAASENGSSSHSFAANTSYTVLKDTFDLFCYLDHDCIPVKDFSVEKILGDKQLAGIGQGKLKTYLWPGCLMFKRFDEIDFSTNSEFKLDTGGNIYKKIEEVGKEQVVFFNEVHTENPDFKKNFYSFYAMINDAMFMHFLNSSGWNPTDAHEERLNSLINILDNK